MRKSQYILCCFLIILFSKLYAQPTEQMTFIASVSFTNKANQKLFKTISDLDSARIVVFSGKPTSMRLHFRHEARRDQTVYEYFDPSFEGDRYYFQKKYKQTLPALPKAEIDSVITMKNCEGDYQVTAILNRDSVVYQL